MEEKVNELSSKIIELENRVNKLELINKKRIRNKIIATIVTISVVIIIAIIYVFIILKIYNSYIDLF